MLSRSRAELDWSDWSADEQRAALCRVLLPRGRSTPLDRSIEEAAEKPLRLRLGRSVSVRTAGPPAAVGGEEAGAAGEAWPRARRRSTSGLSVLATYAGIEVEGNSGTPHNDRLP
jgi:hypothetical protein